MKLIDLDGNTWDGTKLNSKYKPVYDRQGRNEMMGVTLGWLYDAPEFDLKKNNTEIRNKAIDDFVKKLEEHQQENWIDNLEYGITFSDIEQVAEQLKKGDADNE